MDVRRFNNFDDVIEKIKLLDNNDELYMEMLREPILNDLSQLEYDNNLKKFLLNIIDKGTNPSITPGNIGPKKDTA